VGASVGGLLFDGSGYRATFGASALILAFSAVIALLAARKAAVPAAPNRGEAAIQAA
jgi:predicted MFS family arabinose efflux permease